MKVSIVTPSYNQALFVERTILSVLKQGYDDIEYIVMDGGSTDGTIDLLRKYSDRIVWRSEKDGGQSDAINKGLKLATGDILGYLNSDDTYELDAVSRVVEFFQENPDRKWAYGKCRIINECDQEIRKPVTLYKNLISKKYSYRKLLIENFISQPATFWRKALLSEIGYFNENEHLCMDYEYWLRIGQEYPAGVIDEYLANFRYYTDSKSGSSSDKMLDDQLRLAKQYGQKYPMTLLINRINHYKISGVYKLLALLKH